MLKYLLALCLLASPVLAQGSDPGQGRVVPQQIPTAAETALQINNVIGQWATTLTQQSRMIEDLQKQIAAKDARIKELEAKPEPKKE